MNTSKRKRLLADVGLAYAAAIWGSTFFLVKGALVDIDPVTMVAYRFLLAGAVLLVYVLSTKRRILEGIGRAFFLSVILYLLYIPQTVGLGFTTASNSGFITGLFVFFVPVFMITIFRHRPTVMELVGAAVSLVGLWVLTGGLHDINVGDSLTLIAALTYALHVLYSDRYMKAGIDPYVISCQQFLMVGLLSLLSIWLPAPPPWWCSSPCSPRCRRFLSRCSHRRSPRRSRSRSFSPSSRSSPASSHGPWAMRSLSPAAPWAASSSSSPSSSPDSAPIRSGPNSPLFVYLRSG